MARSHESLLDALETRLSAGFLRDAVAVGRMEATARVLLAMGPDEGVPMRDLSRRIARDPSTVTRFAERAAREGLVEQRPGTVDRRQRLLHLTPAGRTAREGLLALRRAREALLKDGIAAATGLGASEVEWFLAAVLEGLAVVPEGLAATREGLAATPEGLAATPERLAPDGGLAVDRGATSGS